MSSNLNFRFHSYSTLPRSVPVLLRCVSRKSSVNLVCLITVYKVIISRSSCLDLGVEACTAVFYKISSALSPYADSADFDVAATQLAE